MTKPYYLMPDDENYISKTEIKKEVKELQALATQLTKLSKSQRLKLPASDELREAFRLADKISNKPDALRRHFQFMTKLLRDEDIDGLKRELHKFIAPKNAPDKFSLEVEDIRQKLMDKGDPEIEILIERCPSLDRQRLRQLTRQAAKEVAKEKPGKSFKELFQYIKTGLQNV